MPNSLKYLASKILFPIAKPLSILQPKWQRLWAYTYLSASLKTPVDPTIIVESCPELQGTRHIQLGKNLYLYRQLYLETQETGHIIIADNVVISRGVHLVAFKQITIGTGSMIGEYSSIRDANHQTGPAHPIIRNSGYFSSPIHIGAQVWIGRGVTILPGVTIGDHAVIGANAVVNKNIPPHSLAAGVPARIIKQL